MKITFIGSSACIPDVGQEVSCLLINGKYLVDTGWNVALKLREHGFNPLEIDSVFFTHIHQDHFLGLPGLIFYLGVQNLREPWNKPLNIIGPAEHIQHLVDSAQEFLQIKRFPELKLNLNVVPITPGDNYENAELYVETFPGLHTSGTKVPEQAIVYKFKEKATGNSFATVWDTSFHPPIAEFVKGEELLIHDAAHTSAKEAAEIGKMAQVKKLYLIHYSSQQGEQKLKEARDVFPNSFLAKEGETLEV